MIGGNQPFLRLVTTLEKINEKENMLNDLIKTVEELGLCSASYDNFNNLGTIATVLFMLWYGRKLHIGWFKIIISILVMLYAIGPITQLVLWIEAGFVVTGKKNIVVGFVYVPLLAFLLSKILRVKWNTMSDFLIIDPLIRHFFARLGCTFMGCCRGIASKWGIYNPQTHTILFPVQLIEAFVTIVLVSYLIYRAKKNQYIPDGMSTPIGLSVYGFIRFFLEFLHDNEKLFAGCSSLAYHSLFMCVVGVIWIAVLRRQKSSP